MSVFGIFFKETNKERKELELKDAASPLPIPTGERWGNPICGELEG